MAKVHRDRTMLVTVTMDRMGCITARPMSRVWRKKFAAHMKDMTGRRYSSAFFQGDYETPETITGHRYYKELEKGWPVTMRIDPWEFGQWLGYDACNVA